MPMHPCKALLAGLAAALLMVACANPQTTLKNIAYGDPAKPYLGMSKAEILACAGEPHSRYGGAGGSETLTYHYSGAGPVPQPPSKSGEKKKEANPFADSEKKSDKDWTCTASLVFENDRLVRVNFSHKDVRSPYDWQKEKDPNKAEKMREEGVPTCTFSLPNCGRS